MSVFESNFGYNAKEKAVSDDVVNNIIAWENGELSGEQEIKFFQKLINSGLAWQLQGSYGRYASTLIEAGLCSPKGS